MKKHLITIETIIIGTIILLLNLHGFGQSLKSLHQLLPLEEVNLESGKITGQVMGSGGSVVVLLYANLDNTDACQKGSISYKGLKVNITWYDKDDELGKSMLEMMDMLNAIPQMMEEFKNESGFDANQAKEEMIEGGKMWVISKSSPCINTISGPTGVTEYKTSLRCFVFNGTTVIKIEIDCNSKAERVIGIARKIVEKAGKFDFTPYKNMVAAE